MVGPSWSRSIAISTRKHAHDRAPHPLPHPKAPRLHMAFAAPHDPRGAAIAAGDMRGKVCKIKSPRPEGELRSGTGSMTQLYFNQPT
jgi:hypothetical protein